MDFDNTTYEPYNENYHTTTLKKGQYCQFCKGTYARASEKKETHNFTDTVDAQIGNNRFYVTEKCEDCGYVASEYVTAKSVISSYYGNVDGEAHTLQVNDLSDNGVKTSIRYGNSADNCTLTSAPNYTQAGYNTVYYKITYSYAGESMTENGVSYVWLLDEPKTDITIIVPETDKKHEHKLSYLETVPATCDNLGYERWQCGECGALEKRNYTPSTGHNYKAIIVRDANCKQNGLKLFVCEMCGDKHITDITPLISHSYERVTKQPTCTDKGYTTSTCTMCGFNYVSDYTDAKGHEWDDGHVITSSACDSEGVIEYHCKHCDEKMIKATNATGHTPGKAATCIEPQVCEKCGTVLALPKGHSYNSKVVPPTCTEMGYTTYTCSKCDESYTGKIPHDYENTVVKPTCTSLGYTVYKCKNCDYTYTSDYVDKAEHKYNKIVTVAFQKK